MSGEMVHPEIGDVVGFVVHGQYVSGTVLDIRRRWPVGWQYLLHYGVTFTWDEPGDLGSEQRIRWVREGRVVDVRVAADLGGGS